MQNKLRYTSFNNIKITHLEKGQFTPPDKLTFQTHKLSVTNKFGEFMLARMALNGAEEFATVDKSVHIAINER